MLTDSEKLKKLKEKEKLKKQKEKEKEKLKKQKEKEKLKKQKEKEKLKKQKEKLKKQYDKNGGGLFGLCRDNDFVVDETEQNLQKIIENKAATSEFLKCLQSYKKPVTEFIDSISPEYKEDFKNITPEIKSYYTESYRLNISNITAEDKEFFLYFINFIKFCENKARYGTNIKLNIENYNKYVQPLITCFNDYMLVIDDYDSNGTAFELSKKAEKLKIEENNKKTLHSKYYTTTDPMGAQREEAAKQFFNKRST